MELNLFFISGVPIRQERTKIRHAYEKICKTVSLSKNHTWSNITQFGNFSFTASSPKSFEFE